ncbi:MAG: discoidin domain-containing protein [Rikenellaceae bacterium]|nr:discoidin domain-containing protein [Rikenellaceae bacterium]
MKRIFLLLAAPLCLFSCSDNDDDNGGKETPPIESFAVIDNSTIYLTPEDDIDITGLFGFSPSNASVDDIIYIVADKNLAVVENGYLRFVANGETTLRAGAQRSFVESAEIDIICYTPTSGISTTIDKVTMIEGGSMTVEGMFIVEPETATDRGIGYTIEDESVVRLEDDMLVPVNIGTTTLRAYMLSNPGMVSTPITVECIPYENNVTAKSTWVAQASTVSAMEGTNLDTGNPFTPEAKYAIDGDLGTYWNSNVSFFFSGEWLTIDLGAVCHVSNITLTDLMGYTLGFDIYLSQTDQAGLEGDDASFIKVGSGTDSQTEVAFGAQSARYVKINITSARGVTSGFLTSYSTTISDVEIK